MHGTKGFEQLQASAQRAHMYMRDFYLTSMRLPARDVSLKKHPCLHDLRARGCSYFGRRSFRLGYSFGLVVHSLRFLVLVIEALQEDL